MGKHQLINQAYTDNSVTLFTTIYFNLRETIKDEEILFLVNVGWVQAEAEKYVDRRLTKSELLSVKKGLEWGLTTDIDTVFKTAIYGAVEISREEKRKLHIKN